MGFDNTLFTIFVSGYCSATDEACWWDLQIHKRAGIRGLYAGVGPTLTRAFPANAAAVVAWELTARFFSV